MSNSSIPRCPFEVVEKEEAGRIEQITDITTQLQEKRYPEKIPVLRGVHPKSHGCVDAIFRVSKDLQDELRVGLFSNPGKEFEAVIRFSNAEATVLPDVTNGMHGSRGMAIKVKDVGGDVLLDDHGAHSQDFLMINQPVFAFSNTEDYLTLSNILIDNDDKADLFFVRVPELMKIAKERPQDLTQSELRILQSAKIVQGIRQTSGLLDANPIEIQYFSAAPFMFGDSRVMKFSAKPVDIDTPTHFPEDPKDNYLREALSASIKQKKNLEFSFSVQVRPIGKDLGIEDASSIWEETEYPFIEIATITIPAPQNNLQSNVSIRDCEQLEYSPWHSLREHQPIGSINRLRESVYLASAKNRRQEHEQCPIE